jgi:TetR/AcrR family transcriptional regulator
MDTRTHILREAKKLFSIEGYDGMKMERLAELCGKNKATIYYYFDSKAVLYNEIIIAILEALQVRLSQKIMPDDTPQEKLRQFIKSMSECDPLDVRLIQREMTGESIKSENEIFALLLKNVTLLKTILAEGIEQKLFNDVEPFVVMQVVMGTLNHYILSTAFRQKVCALPQGDDVGKNLQTDPALFFDELYTFILHAIEAKHD